MNCLGLTCLSFVLIGLFLLYKSIKEDNKTLFLVAKVALAVCVIIVAIAIPATTKADRHRRECGGAMETVGYSAKDRSTVYEIKKCKSCGTVIAEVTR